MKLLTDYPLFPSESGKAGPFRIVTVIKYDGNKYCYVEYDGLLHAIKAGYLYRSRRKVMIKHETMCRWFNKKP
jgi:hypothetical protein